MTSEEHKSIVRRFIKAFETNDQDTLMEVVAVDFMANVPGLPDEVDRDTLLQRIGLLSAAFSELRATIDDQIAEDDKVATRFTWQGTHTGDFQGISPTGKHVEISAVSIERFDDGKIVERWFNQDDLGLMMQLGLIPPPQ